MFNLLVAFKCIAFGCILCYEEHVRKYQCVRCTSLTTTPLAWDTVVVKK